ncbi:MAG: transposon-encoded TnpW family protein [Firmicutes bacterium]|nr:transposon-encoded TnpW family protein [Bacillota bacterium]
MFSTAAPAANQAAQTALEAGVFIKRVGYTTYHVGVHFSGTSTETARDKILRLVKNEAAARKEAGP